MTDIVKIAVRAGLVAVITGAVIALFAGLQVPAIDWRQFAQALAVPLALCRRYVPAFSFIWIATKWLLGVWLALQTFKVASLAWRWILRVTS